MQPLLRFRMQDGYRDVWSGVERVARENPALVDFVREEVAARGPVSARELEVAEVRDRSNWGWNWSSVKTVLEWLFYCGEVTSARRNSAFERVYDLPERVLPRAVLDQPTPTPAESVTGLLRRAAQALGVVSELCLRDYFRTRPGMTRDAVAELVETGELVPVTVEGLEARPHYLWHQAARPRRIDGPRPAQPVRLDGLRASPATAAVRLRLPDRDLRPRAETDTRLLRLSVPARRPFRGASRPQGRPGPWRAAGQLGLVGARSRSRLRRRRAGRRAAAVWPSGRTCRRCRCCRGAISARPCSRLRADRGRSGRAQPRAACAGWPTMGCRAREPRGAADRARE